MACRHSGSDGACSPLARRCQARHPVLGNLFALVAQIVGQLAIAVDLTAIGPGLSDQFGLTCILLRTVT